MMERERENWNFIKFPALDWQNSRDAENAVCGSDKFNIEQFTETLICSFLVGEKGDICQQWVHCMSTCMLSFRDDIFCWWLEVCKREYTSVGLMEIIKFASVCRPYGRRKFMYGKFVDKKFQGLTSWVSCRGDMKKAFFALIRRVQVLSLFWTLKIHENFNNFSLFSRPKMWKLGTLSCQLSKELFILSSTFDFSHRFSPE